MTPDDLLADVLARAAALGGESVPFSASELARWPTEAVIELKAHKLLTRAPPSRSAVCSGCEEECTMPVHVNQAPFGEPAAFVVCDRRDDVHRVSLSLHEIERWQTSVGSIADALAAMLGLRLDGTADLGDGRWKVGLLRGRKHSSHLVLSAEDELSLMLAGYSVPLVEVLRFASSALAVDRVRLMRLVDQPAAGGGDVESAAQRRRHLRKRVKELRDNGVKAFLKTVADEEGISVQRLKQLLKSDPKAVNPSLRW